MTVLRYKSPFERRNPDLLVNFGQFSCFLIQIRIPIADPNPGQPNECRSMRILIEIHNTDFYGSFFAKSAGTTEQRFFVWVSVIPQDPILKPTGTLPVIYHTWQSPLTTEHLLKGRVRTVILGFLQQLPIVGFLSGIFSPNRDDF